MKYSEEATVINAETRLGAINLSFVATNPQNNQPSKIKRNGNINNNSYTILVNIIFLQFLLLPYPGKFIRCYEMF